MKERPKNPTKKDAVNVLVDTVVILTRKVATLEAKVALLEETK